MSDLYTYLYPFTAFCDGTRYNHTRVRQVALSCTNEVLRHVVRGYVVQFLILPCVQCFLQVIRGTVVYKWQRSLQPVALLIYCLLYRACIRCCLDQCHILTPLLCQKHTRWYSLTDRIIPLFYLQRVEFNLFSRVQTRIQKDAIRQLIDTFLLLY